MPETDLKNAILDYLGYKNIYCWLNNTMGNYNPKTNSYYKNPRLTKGVADIIGLLPSGQLLAIECKFGKNKQSEAQKEFQTQVVANNGVYLLIYNLEEVEEYFNKLK